MNSVLIAAGPIALGAIAALWLCACALLAALSWARWLVPGAGLPLRWSASFALGMWWATLGFHGLRGAGLFSLGPAVCGCTLLAVVSHYGIAQRRSPFWLLRREARALGRVFRLLCRSELRLVWVVLAACGVVTAVRSLVIPPLGWDTLTYHGVRSVLWLQSSQLSFDPGPGPFDFYRHFFAGAEVLIAWALLPFHSDLLANLVLVVEWLGVGLASCALARAIGLRGAAPWVSAVSVMFIPSLLSELGSGYVEVALNAALLTGAALAVHGLSRCSGRANLAVAMALGVACGIKLTAVPPAAVIAIALAARMLADSRMSWLRKLVWLTACAGGMLAPGLPWSWFAWSETGYPLSPMPVHLFGWQLGVESPAMRWYQLRPDLVAYTARNELAAARALFAPFDRSGGSFGVLALIPLAVCPLGWVVLVKRRLAAAFILTLTGLAPVVAHVSPSMRVVRLGWSESSSRFMIVSLAIGITISLAIGLARARIGRGYARVLLCYPVFYAFWGLQLGWGAWETSEIAVCGAVIATAVLCVALCKRSITRLTCFVVVCVLGCVSLQQRRDLTRAEAFSTSYAGHDYMHYWAPALAHVDTPARAQRIAVTGGALQACDKWFQYFLFGRRLQNRVHYVSPTRDGAIAHFGPFGDFYARADEKSWRARLRSWRATHVMSFGPRSLEQRWMDANPALFHRLAGTQDWGLYRVDP